MKKTVFLGALAFTLLSGSAFAQVTGTVSYVNPDTGAPGGTFSYLSTPPASIGNNNVNINDTVFAFTEKQNVAFGNAPAVDQGGPIASNTVVSSYFVYFDPRVSQSISASLTFQETILGVYLYKGTKDTPTASGTSLWGSEDNFGLSSVTYNYVSATGLESGDRSASYFSFSGNHMSLSWTASSPGDHIRVLTAVSAVPETETFAMMLAGLGLMGTIARRRKLKAA